MIQGFNRLDELGWVRQVPQDERYQQLAADYVAAVAKGETALVVSPTHAEGDRITAEIRQTLREADIARQRRAERSSSSKAATSPPRSAATR